MGKQTKITATYLSDEAIRYTKYKWEFLRRNPAYIEEWNQLEKHEGSDDPVSHVELELFLQKWNCALGSPYSSYDDYMKIQEEYNFLVHENLKLKAEIEAYKAIAVAQVTNKESPDNTQSIINPNISKLSLPDDDFTPIVEMPKLLHSAIYPDIGTRRPLRVLESLGDEKKCDKSDSQNHTLYERVMETGRLKIEIDLSYSKNRLRKEYDHLLDEWQPVLDEEKRQRNENRYHFDNFDIYLNVYDLRNAGISWMKIKQALKLNSVQTARNHHKAACELIYKGIDLYVK